MKKATLLLGLILFFTGANFASFHVSKPAKEVKENSTVIDKEISESAELTTDSNIAEVTLSETKSDAKSKSKGGDKDRTLAIVLALVSVLFLPFGLHNWYLGRKKQALWQTLMVVPGFVLLFLPAIASWIWQLVDLFRLLGGGLM